MRFARDGWAITSGQYEAAGKELPQWYRDEPLLDVGEAFFMGAFLELSSCRQIGMGPGPIPWTAIQAYADQEKLDPDVATVFADLIRALDREYLERDEERSEKLRKSASGGK